MPWRVWDGCGRRGVRDAATEGGSGEVWGLGGGAIVEDELGFGAVLLLWCAAACVVVVSL